MSLAPTVLVPRGARLGEGFTRREQLTAKEAKGRPWHRVAGGWVADLVGKRLCIILCPFHVSKFNPRHNQYEVWRRHQWAIGKCDECGQVSSQNRVFIHQSTHDAVGEWTRPRRGRWRTT